MSYGPQRAARSLSEQLADARETLGILALENRKIGELARRLIEDRNNLLRLIELQQRRLDGYEAEEFSLREA